MRAYYTPLFPFCRPSLQASIFALALFFNFSAQAQTVYQIEKFGKIQYLIPATIYAEPGEFKISNDYIKLLTRATVVRIHSGKGIVNTKNTRSSTEFFRHEKSLIDYIKWCTDDRIDLSKPENKNIRVTAMLTVDKCALGDTPLRTRRTDINAKATFENSIAALTTTRLYSENSKLQQAQPLVEADAWMNAVFNVDDSLADQYLNERAAQWSASSGSTPITQIESTTDVLLQGRKYADSWLSRFGRFQYASTSGSQVAAKFVGARAALLTDSILKNFDSSQHSEQINFIPFEYMYLSFGVIRRLEQSGFLVKEVIFR